MSFSRISDILLGMLEGLGRFAVFCARTVRWMARDIVRIRRWRLTLPQLYEVGTRSLFVIMLTGAFIGMVLAIELYAELAAWGQETRVGGIINISVIKHIGPVLAAVMLSGRVGGAFSAELGTMSVTEQIDALRVMATNPISYLVVPRVFACVLMIPLLTIFSDLLGMFGSWLITVVIFNVPNYEYWSFSASFVSAWDISVGLIKSLFFGAAIGLVCCYKGFHCGKGAQGVGKATTDAFVTSFVTIIILDFVIAKFTSDLYVILFGHSVASIG